MNLESVVDGLHSVGPSWEKKSALADEAGCIDPENAADIRAITPKEVAGFKHGLCIQVDRSQSHLSRPKDGLNTKNGKGMNVMNDVF